MEREQAPCRDSTDMAARLFTSSDQQKCAKANEVIMETPVGLRRIMTSDSKEEFSGFRDEKFNVRRLEREVRCLCELVTNILGTQETQAKEYQDLKERMVINEKVSEENKMMKEEVEGLKRENEVLKKKCEKYERELKRLNDKIENSVRESKSEMGENKLVELRNVWKKEQEEEKVKFTEVVERQI